jgi:hypothetical protein
MQQGELGTMPVPAFAELTVTPPPAMAEPEPVAAPPEVPAEVSATTLGGSRSPCLAARRCGSGET